MLAVVKFLAVEPALTATADDDPLPNDPEIDDA